MPSIEYIVGCENVTEMCDVFFMFKMF